MKKIILILLLLYIYPVKAEAGIFKVLGSVIGSVGSFIGISGGSKTHLDLSKRETKDSVVKTGANDNKLVLSELIKVNQKMDKMIEVNNDVQAKVTAVDKSMQAGRDMTITNDPKVLKPVIYGLIGIIMLLIRSIFADRKLSRIERRQRDGHIAAVQKKKDEYKDKLLTYLVTGDKKALIKNGSEGVKKE